MGSGPDAALLHKAQQGDTQAIEGLVEAYHAQVYRLCLRLLGHEADAQDAAQETFLRLFRGIAKFRRQADLTTWVYRIATNVCRDEARRRKRRPPVRPIQDDNDPLREPSDPAGSAESQAMARADRWQVVAALQHLSEPFRAVLVLREIEDLSYEQIGRVLRCPIGTVRSRLARARRLLRGLMADGGESDAM